MKEDPNWRHESLKKDLSFFPVFGALVRWFGNQIPKGFGNFYWEYPALLGQIIFFSAFIIFNGILNWRGIDTATNVPFPLFFAVDILNFGFLKEPYLLTFIAMAFLLAWIVNKLVLIFFPRLRNSSNAVLFLTAIGSGVVSLLFFGIIFSVMVAYFV